MISSSLNRSVLCLTLEGLCVLFFFNSLSLSLHFMVVIDHVLIALCVQAGGCEFEERLRPAAPPRLPQGPPLSPALPQEHHRRRPEEAHHHGPAQRGASQRCGEAYTVRPVHVSRHTYPANPGSCFWPSGHQGAPYVTHLSECEGR